jgi:hypothetical protein
MADPILEVSLLPADDGSGEPGEPGEPGSRRRPRAVAVLAAALVVALAVAGVLAWRLWHAQDRPGGQEEAVAVVERYTEAFDAHDLEGLRETLADQAAFSAGEHLDQQVVGPFSGKELDDFYTSLFRSDVHLTTDGPVQVTGNGPYRVVAVQTVRYTVAGVAVTEQAMSLYTLLQLPDRPVILEHVWWRPLAAHAPSMLWAR